MTTRTVTLSENAYGQIAATLRLKLAELRDEAADCDRVGLSRIGDFYRERANTLKAAVAEFDGSNPVHAEDTGRTQYVYVYEDGKTLTWDSLGDIEDLPF